MKIHVTKYESAKRITLEEFADEHGLEMQVMECSDGTFRAAFKDSEIRHGTCMLVTKQGTGATMEEAFADYAKAISNQLLIIRSMNPKKRREILVPMLSPKTSTK